MEVQILSTIIDTTFSNELDYMIKTQTQQNIKENINLQELIKTRIEFLSSVPSPQRANLQGSSPPVCVQRIGRQNMILPC